MAPGMSHALAGTNKAFGHMELSLLPGALELSFFRHTSFPFALGTGPACLVLGVVIVLARPDLAASTVARRIRALLAPSISLVFPPFSQRTATFHTCRWRASLANPLRFGFRMVPSFLRARAATSAVTRRKRTVLTPRLWLGPLGQKRIALAALLRDFCRLPRANPADTCLGHWIPMSDFIAAFLFSALFALPPTCWGLQLTSPAANASFRPMRSFVFLHLCLGELARPAAVPAFRLAGIALCTTKMRVVLAVSAHTFPIHHCRTNEALVQSRPLRL